MPFPKNAKLEVAWLDHKNWKLMSPLIAKGKHDQIIVEDGFVTDFATVPWWSRWLLPPIGKWSRAVVVHDKLCTLLRERYDARRELWLSNPDLTWADTDELVPRCTFGPVDTDGLVFEHLLRDEGVDFVRQKLLWTGVRWGALANPARREGWWSTFPAVALWSTLAIVYLASLLTAAWLTGTLVLSWFIL